MKLSARIQKNTSLITLLSLSLCLLPSCAREVSDNIYTEASINDPMTTRLATVIERRTIKLQQSDKLGQNGSGSSAGGIGGAVAGSQLGQGKGSIAAGIGGAIVGSVAGALIEKKLNTQDAFEYIVEVKNSQELKTVVQGGNPIEVGQEVYLMEPIVRAGIPTQARARIRAKAA